jgi:hypothetical protein
MVGNAEKPPAHRVHACAPTQSAQSGKIISTHPCVVCNWNSCGRSGCADTADGEPPPASEAAAARRAAIAEVGDDDGGEDDGEASETRSERMDRSMLERPLIFGCEGEGPLPLRQLWRVVRHY